MAGRCRIENHMIKFLRSVRIAQKQCKLVKRSNLDSAGSRQPFLEQRDFLLREYASVRPHRPFAIFAGGLFGVDVHGLKVRDPGNLRRAIRKPGAEDCVEIRCRIGAYQKYAPPFVGKQDSACTGERCLSNSAFAGEE